MQSKTSSHSVQRSTDFPVLKEAIRIQYASRQQPHTRMLSALMKLKELKESVMANVMH